jgi:hypothetical protein
MKALIVFLFHNETRSCTVGNLNLEKMRLVQDKSSAKILNDPFPKLWTHKLGKPVNSRGKSLSPFTFSGFHVTLNGNLFSL